MIRRTGLLILVVSFLTVCPVALQARSIPPLEGLEALRGVFAGISDFSADITQEKRISLMKRTLVMSGTVRFKKPDQFYMEINPPFSSRMLLRDTVIEQAAGKDGEKNRVVLPADQGLKRWFSKLTAPLTALPDGLYVQTDLTNGTYTMDITPQGKGQIKTLSIVFMGDGSIRRLTLHEQNGDRAVLSFKRFRKNIGLSDKDFRLE